MNRSPADNPVFDYHMMMRAIKLGEMGRINAPPNPWVGCVIVKNGEVIAEGYHTHAGAPHAEAAALAQTTNAKDAIVYVTLEPCAHHGKTPPCTDALIKAQVGRVVVGTLDPDPRVSGKGIKLLQNGGIDVSVGVAESEVKRSLAPYLYQRAHGRVYNVLKIACSLDGQMCAKDHSSQWITGETARIDANHLRAQSQAIITGSGTVKYDNPRLTVRAPIPLPMKPPLRVILDSKGISDTTAKIFDPSMGPSLLITTEHCPKERLKMFSDEGIDVEIVNESKGKICLPSAFEVLSSKGIIQTLVEAGPTLTSEILLQGLFHQLTLYIGPKVIGAQGLSFSKTIPWTTLQESLSLKLLSHFVLEDTIRLDYKTLSAGE